ncbi:CLC10 protein, partial [Amia calva]|nr:CLC10 protein [Amia calva]
MSAERLPWDEARDYCVGKGGYLAILKSPQERGFVSRRTMPNYYWIGLTDARTGSWEWVDKTPYVMVREEWMPNQPDDWSHHGLGGGEDCAHLHIDGRLNDDHCSRRYYFVCEY